METMQAFHTKRILFGSLSLGDFMTVNLKNPIEHTQKLTEDVTIVPIFCSKYI